MLKNLSSFANLLKSAGQITSRAEESRNRLAAKEILGTSEDQTVRILVNGIGEVLNVEISPQAVDPDNIQQLQESVKQAMTQAVAAAKKLHAAEIKSVTGDLEIPGLDGLIKQFTG